MRLEGLDQPIAMPFRGDRGAWRWYVNEQMISAQHAWSQPGLLRRRRLQPARNHGGLAPGRLIYADKLRNEAPRGYAHGAPPRPFFTTVAA